MRARFLLFVATCVGASACAAILGIDDGIPRTPDASVDAPSNPDGGADAPGDAAPDKIDGPYVPLACGASAACNVALGEACCRTGSTTYSCIDAGTTCSGTLIQCDRPEMCPQGDSGPVICCADLVSTEAGAVASSVSCKLEALCTYSSHAWLCDDAGECPAEAGCLQSSFTIPPYFICK